MALRNATLRAPALEVRQASLDDLDAIREVAALAFDREPIQRGALVDLLYRRPPGDASLRLVALVDGALAGFAFGSRPNQTGFLDAIAVDPAWRRRGVGSALLAATEVNLLRAGATSLRIGGNTWFYAWPGVDLAYTAALSLAERCGYRRSGLAQNMDVLLDRWLPGSAPAVLVRHDSSVVARRATPADWPALEAFIQREFDDVWRHETQLAVHRDFPSAFVAIRENAVVGFGCHGVYRRDWFGPIGTAAGERGNGTGEALLRLCLDDLAAAGIAVVQICWIGPMSFYSRSVDARCGRQFVMFEKDLPSAHEVPDADRGA